MLGHSTAGKEEGHQLYSAYVRSGIPHGGVGVLLLPTGKMQSVTTVEGEVALKATAAHEGAHQGGPLLGQG